MVGESGTKEQLDGVRLAKQGLTKLGEEAGKHPGRMNECRAEPRELLFYRISFALEEFPPLIVDQPKLAADGRQTQVRVVLAQRQTILGAAGEHAVRLGRTAGDEVIHQHADVSFAALRAPGFAAAGQERSVDAGQ